MRFSKDDAGVLGRYRVFRERVWSILGSLRKEVLEAYEVEWDGVNYEQGGYFFLRFRIGSREFSPGVKVSEEYVVKPVFWVTKATLDGEASKSLGFKEDPEFKGYLMRQLELEEEFFVKSSEAQEKEILEFFRDVLIGLEEEGVIDPVETPRYFAAG